MYDHVKFNLCQDKSAWKCSLMSTLGTAKPVKQAMWKQQALAKPEVF